MASKKIESLKKRLSEIEKELKTLGQFRQTKAVQQFKRQLVGELSFVKRQIQLQKPHKETAKERQRRQARTNRERSQKMKRTWRYIKSIQQNYAPDKSAKEIRSLLKRRKEGIEVEIPDVAWRNPSL